MSLVESALACLRGPGLSILTPHLDGYVATLERPEPLCQHTC